MTVDRDRCAGSGMCALTAPEVFEQDGEGLGTAPDPSSWAEHAEAAAEAAGLCPVGAITVSTGH
ncbi:ferredoxin [Actinorhabdospora filicis]|uniref:ferredoxin n=1 Tax=Actinorhabdospora filicis TaxID=1785913 RepID=UPI002555DA6C|nr:ferredoxin [Actinorhabdospora filicis]